MVHGLYFANLFLIFYMVGAVSTFSQLGRIIDGAAENESFGAAVSISRDGNTFIVGSPGHSVGNISNAGSVRVYTKNLSTNNYTQFGPDIDGEAFEDTFGSALSISGDGKTFIVGAANLNGDPDKFGSVRVYKINPSGTSFVQFGTVISDGTFVLEAFGQSLSISGDGSTFVVSGLSNFDGTTVTAARIRAYKIDSSNTSYVKFGSDIDGKEGEISFGSTVRMSEDGTTFITSSSYNQIGDSGNYTSGNVTVYTINPSNTGYAQFGSDIDDDGVLPNFGLSLSISKNGATFVVGSTGDTGGAGNVRVYKLDASGLNYKQFGSTISSGAMGDLFGLATSMSGDGNTFIVSAPFANNSNISYAGSVRVYQLDASGTNYAPTGPEFFGDSPGLFGDTFGASVSISGDNTTFIVGASFDDNGNVTNSGSVVVFQNRPVTTTLPKKCGFFRRLFGTRGCPPICGVFRTLFQISGC